MESFCCTSKTNVMPDVICHSTSSHKYIYLYISQFNKKVTQLYWVIVKIKLNASTLLLLPFISLVPCGTSTLSSFALQRSVSDL